MYILGLYCIEHISVDRDTNRNDLEMKCEGSFDVCVLGVCLNVPRHKANEFICRLCDSDD